MSDSTTRFDEVIKQLQVQGISFLLTGADKRPFGLKSWKERQSRMPIEKEYVPFLRTAPGIATICGQVSGGLEVLDFEGKYGVTCVFGGWWKMLPSDLSHRLVVNTTSGGGFHVRWKCPDAGVVSPQKLAHEKVGDQWLDLIETKAEGGYALIPPSPGYDWVGVSNLASIPTITTDERDFMLDAARSFETKVDRPQPQSGNADTSDTGKGDRPGDVYNRTDAYKQILEKHGWSCVHATPDRELWKRPGTEHAYSARIFNDDPKIFYPFSTNCAPFIPEKGVTPFTVYALLEHGGDFRAAARALGGRNQNERTTGQSSDGGDDDSDDKCDKSTDEWVSSIVDETDEAKRKKMIDDFLMTLVDRSPLDIEIALKALNKADKALGMSMLRKQLDFLRRQFMPGVGGEKTAKELAQEFLDTRYRHESGELTVVFQNDSWYEWTGAKYDELIRSEYDTKIIKMITEQVAMDVSQNLVTSIRLATQPEALVSRHLQAPFWRSTEMYTEDLISLENGILDLKALFDGQPNALIPHTPDLFILSNQPYPYDESAQCPRWLQFLDESMIEYELKLVIQEFFGLSLTHDQRFHKFLFLQGESRTGKGVTFSVLQALVGQDNVSNVPLREFGNQFGLYPMFGKKLNINAEIPELDKVAEDVLKEYTGGSTVINYNRKNIATPIISPQRARLAFSSNHFPTFTDRTGGLWNRMLLIPFQNVVSADREDVGLIDHLITKELSGIFNWAVEGYRRLCKQGRFTVSKAIDDSVNDYKTESIPVNSFLDTYIVFDENSKRATHSKTLYRYYVLWAKCEGKYQQNAVTFGRDVGAYVLAKKIGRGERDRYGTLYHGMNFDDGKIGKPDAKTVIVERAMKMGIIRDDVTWDYDHDDTYDRVFVHEYDNEELL